LGQINTTCSIIDKALQRLTDQGLCGQAYVKQYLGDLQRRNCRPSTIRNNFQSIALFLHLLKNSGRNNLETITREEFSAFIEYQQDWGLKPRSVSTRLRALSAFFRYLIEREVLHPDVLKRRMRIKIPDSLPRAIDPEDIKALLAVIDSIIILLRTVARYTMSESMKLKPSGDVFKKETFMENL
jgi:integrase/recombinase XerD